jgi:hypothetical protein
MADAARAQRKPFAGPIAGRDYFDSEAHYRQLAATIREQLQQRGGFALLSGNPSPHGDLLARQLTVVGTPRCRATVLKCESAMSYAELLATHRRLAGTTIATWSSRPAQMTRGQELDILVLDHADRLSSAVLEELCHAPTPEGGRRPALLLLTDDATAARLGAISASIDSPAIAAHFHLHRLAAHEVGSFIRYQMTAADLNELDVFKAEVLDLIEAYADGDPNVVNSLARRILRSSTSMRFAMAAGIAALAPTTKPITEHGTAATIAFPSIVRDVPADPDPVVEAPEQPAPPAENVVAAIPAPHHAPVVEPVAELDVEEPMSAASPPLPVEAIVEEQPAVDEEPIESPPPEIAVVIETPAAAEPIVTAPLDDLLPSPAEYAATDEPEPGAPTDATEAGLDVSEEEIVDVETVADLSVSEFSGGVAEDIRVDEDRSPEPVPARAKRPNAFVLLSAGVLAIAVILVVALTIFSGGHPIELSRPYLERAKAFTESLMAPSQKPPTPPAGSASVAVPPDNSTQSLRTTNDDGGKSLLIEPAPTLRDDTSANSKPPTAPANANPAPAATPASQQSNKTIPQVVTPIPAPIPIPEPAPAAAAPAPAPMPAPAAVAPPVIVSPPPAPTAPSPPERSVAIVPPPAASAPARAQPAPSPAPRETAVAPAARSSTGTDVEQLLRRGDQLLASGDIIAARHFFELVSEAGDSRAALRLGKTYDPAFLQQSGVRGIAGNPATAKFWYLKAIASGDKDADMRLLQLMTLYPE